MQAWPDRIPSPCKYCLLLTVMLFWQPQFILINAHAAPHVPSTGLNSRTLEDFTAALEDPNEPFADSYLDRYLASIHDGDESGDATPIPSGSLSVSHGWSDTTFTGSASGRCSTYSWGVDEGVSRMCSIYLWSVACITCISRKKPTCLQ